MSVTTTAIESNIFHYGCDSRYQSRILHLCICTDKAKYMTFSNINCSTFWNFSETGPSFSDIDSSCTTISSPLLIACISSATNLSWICFDFRSQRVQVKNLSQWNLRSVPLLLVQYYQDPSRNLKALELSRKSPSIIITHQQNEGKRSLEPRCWRRHRLFVGEVHFH